MDRIEVTALGLGVFATTQLAGQMMCSGQNGNMRCRMRAEAQDNLNNIETESSGNSENIVPGIALDEFASNKYRISFKYPRSWSKNPRYDDKYEGATGFFEVGDFESTDDDIDRAVQTQIDEEYKPYGSNPTVRRFVVDGEPARVIYPSEDQPDFFSDRDAAIVVQYPSPIQVDDKTYNYVVIWVSRDYIPLILSTFRFIK